MRNLTAFTARRLARACTAALIGLLVASPAAAQTFDIPTDGPRSPTFGAQPFTQRVMLFEEFGTFPMPTTACTNCAPLPPVTSCFSGPSGTALDSFLRQPLWPAPTREANTSRGSYWASAVGSCVRPLATSAVEGRPPGEWYAHQRWEEFAPRIYFQTAQAGARVNNGLRDGWQRHRYNVGEFRRNGGLYYNGGTTRGTQVRFHPSMPI